MQDNGMPPIPNPKRAFAFVLRPCLQCGKVGWASKYKVRDGKGRFCSNACQVRHYWGDSKERFWTLVAKGDGCWEWLGSKTNGYGQYEIRGKGHRAHRLAWEWTIGPIPAGLDLCHRCDNPGCVRPDHLFPGTAADNMRDCAAKGRIVHGERQHLAKLTADDVVSIRRRRSCGEQCVDLAREYSIDPSTVSQICARLRWKHVP